MDFNARQYDPQLGRFLGVDPLATSGGQDMFSPYAAMGNAPERIVDPNGTSLMAASEFNLLRDQRSGFAAAGKAFMDAFGKIWGGNGGGTKGSFAGFGTGASGGAVTFYGKAARAVFSLLQGTTQILGDGNAATNLDPKEKNDDKEKESDLQNSDDDNKNVSQVVYNIKDIKNATRNGVSTPESYFENISKDDYYVKPETNGEAVVVKPGQVYTGRIDGFGTKEMGVYKVPDFTRVIVAEEGYLIFNRSWLIGAIHGVLNKKVERVDNVWLEDRHRNQDYGWDNLFKSIR